MERCTCIHTYTGEEEYGRRLSVEDSRSHRLSFAVARCLCVPPCIRIYTLFGVGVHAGTSLEGGRIVAGGEREGRERNGAGDNNHNNLVKRYKDISH